jgi:hypothetical protein
MSKHYAINKLILNGDGAFPIRGRCKPDEGSEIIIFQEMSDDINFVSHAKVASVKYEDLGEGRRGTGTAIIDRLEPLLGERPLSGLSGSLQKTRFFLEPQRHFRQDIVALSPEDFQAIQTGEVDLPRSIFRMTFHALPLELQAEFVRLHANLFPKIEGRGRWFDYNALAAALLDFYEERLSMGFNLLQMVETSYPSSIPGVPDISGLYLSAGSIENERSPQMIPLGLTVGDLLSFGQESYVTGGLFAFAAKESGSKSSPGSGFIADARAALEESSQSMGGRKWRDSIF